MILGFDYLGAVKFQNEMLSAHIKGYSAAIFLKTFGDATKTLKAMLESGKFSEIVVHLATFDPTHNYPVQENLAGLLAAASVCQKLSSAHPQTTLLLSPFCEHNHSAKDMIPVFNKLKDKAPSCLMVNSIWKGEVIDGIITEIHLQNSKIKVLPPKGEFIISFDGFGGDGTGDFSDCDFQTIAAKYPMARQIRGWAFRCNGKFGHKDVADVAHRVNWPSKEYLKGQLAIMSPREGSITYPDNALYKPFADDHGQGGKDNKALIICQKDKEYLDVKDKNGKKIAKMTRFRPDHTEGKPFGPRYYSDKYAYQLADLAEKSSGSRLIQIDGLPLTDGDLRSNLFI